MATPAELLAICAVGLGNVATWVKVIYDANQRKRNGHGTTTKLPGACPSHIEIATALAASQTDRQGIRNELSLMRTANDHAHDLINSKLDALVSRIRPPKE